MRWPQRPRSTGSRRNQRPATTRDNGRQGNRARAQLSGDDLNRGGGRYARSTSPSSVPLGAVANRPASAEARRVMALKRRLPTSADLRARAKKRLPHFAYEYCDGGAGGVGYPASRNNNAFDAIPGGCPAMARWYRRRRPIALVLVGRYNGAHWRPLPRGAEHRPLSGAPTYLAKACQAAGVPIR